MKRGVVLRGVAVALFLASAAWARQQKVEICHLPPDNPANAHTINVSEKALPDHLAHGDAACSCEVADGVNSACGGQFDPTTCECVTVEYLGICVCTDGTEVDECVPVEACGSDLADDCDTFCFYGHGGSQYSTCDPAYCN